MATVAGHQGHFVSWHTAYPAEAVASGASSASCQDRFEDVRILPVVVTELEFRKVERQIFLTHIVIRAHDAPFQQRPERFDVLSVNLPTYVFTLTVAYNFMLRNKSIARVLIGCNEVNIVCDYLAHKTIERWSIGVLDYLARDVALPADSSNNCGFAGKATSALYLFVPMAVAVLAANERFVYLDGAHELRKVCILHCGADALADIPSRFVGARTDHPMNLKGRDAFLALAHQIDNLEPRYERDVCVLENGLSNYREPIAVLLAISALPVESLFQRVNLIVATTRTLNDTIWPTHVAEQSLASIVGCVIAFYIGQSQIRLRGKWLTRLHEKRIGDF
jgi:hypothetical protein